MWRALAMNIATFSLLFLLHILFASQNFDLAFSVVALFISLQVILFGPLTVHNCGGRRRGGHLDVPRNA